MPIITLPDGSELIFKQDVTGQEVATTIGKNLAHDAVAIRIGSEVWDLTRNIINDSLVEIITRNTPDGLELLRHDAAHVLA